MPKTLTDLGASNLSDRVKNYLQMQHIPALKKLAVEADHDTVAISGNVDTFYERQVAIECCKRVAGVRSVVDHVNVSTPATVPTPQRQLSGPHRRLPR